MFWDQVTEALPNPVEVFVEFKGWEFTTYNKELWENVTVKVDKFILLDQVSCVKGRDVQSNSGIYSNEVHSLMNEDLVIRSFKWDGIIYQGKYSDGKAEIKEAGGVFHKGLLVLLDGLLCEIYLKGGALKEFNDFMQELGKERNTHWITIPKMEERKNGAIKYSVPTFKKGKEIEEADKEKAIKMVEQLRAFYESKKQDD